MKRFLLGETLQMLSPAFLFVFAVTNEEVDHLFNLAVKHNNAKVYTLKKIFRYSTHENLPRAADVHYTFTER